MATVGKIFGSYQLNAGVAGGEIQADTQLTTKIFQSTMSSIRHAEDVSDRRTQAESDFLRGNTVIRDTELNGHGRVSADVADDVGVRAGTAASELEAQQPHLRVLIVGRSELPFPGGIARRAREILAGPGIIQSRADNVARAVNAYPHRDLEAAVNRLTCAA